MRNRGARLLAAKGLRQEIVARAADVSRVAVSQWVNGSTKPSEAKREVLLGLYEIPKDSWDDETATTPVGVAIDPAKQHRPVRVRGRASVDDLEEAIEDCNRLLDLADAEGGSVRDRSGLLATKVSAVVKLAKLRGEDSMTVERFRKTRDWQNILKAIEAGLKDHPAAARLIYEELAKIGI